MIETQTVIVIQCDGMPSCPSRYFELDPDDSLVTVISYNDDPQVNALVSAAKARGWTEYLVERLGRIHLCPNCALKSITEIFKPVP